MFAIFKREFASYFTSPLGYIVLAIYVFFSALFTMLMYYGTGYSYSIADAIAPMLYFALFIIPPITMRSFTEDKKNRTDQLLLTAPVKVSSVVFGKYLSAFALYLICCMSYVLYVLVTFLIVPDAVVEWGVMASALIGLVLLGGAMLAINLLYSSLTESQILAVVIGMGTGLLVMIYDNIVMSVESVISQMTSSDYSAVVLDKLSVTAHYQNFISGVISPANFVFFLTWIGLFLFLTMRVLDKKRWA
ncbi:MAG: ABC transporter permease subunit [Ruminococcus sp.]|nr:ABC transporter permease subunit [Ruminococcus sp.]